MTITTLILSVLALASGVLALIVAFQTQASTQSAIRDAQASPESIKAISERLDGFRTRVETCTDGIRESLNIANAANDVAEKTRSQTTGMVGAATKRISALEAKVIEERFTIPALQAPKPQEAGGDGSANQMPMFPDGSLMR